jgi:hypothetical protein
MIPAFSLGTGIREINDDVARTNGMKSSVKWIPNVPRRAIAGGSLRKRDMADPRRKLFTVGIMSTQACVGGPWLTILLLVENCD